MRKRNKRQNRKTPGQIGWGNEELFYFVAGYTSGGAAYGITHAEMEAVSQGDQKPVVGPVDPDEKRCPFT